MTTSTPASDMVARLDFDRLAEVVVERIRALQLVATSGATGALHEPICRDLVLPAIGILTEFLQAVKVGDADAAEDEQS